MAASELKHILVGTAGHIDHGKTRLVGRLTQIDTDRLPEEKARGISIDLGFAHWETDGVRFGVVDVPGHERFVKNMVAGATGVNLALLVIAADDSVMPQTREHLEIMDLLGMRAGLIAITKIDLVDREFIELVEAEIEEEVAGTFLEGCAIVPVSSETGEGIEDLQKALLGIAREIELAEVEPLFRMPIDRAISLPGHGTIVTGSVLSGDVHPGDTLDLWPAGREVRVRSVENHGVEADDAGARQRTAINLAGVKQDEVARGAELASVGFLKPTRRLLVELRLLSSSPVLLKDRVELNLHLGTREVPARVILKGRQLKPGERGYAELRMSEDIVAAWGQRFILRRISPALTVAGGRVLDPWLPVGKRIRDLEAAGEALGAANERERLVRLLGSLDDVPDSPLEASWRAGIPADRYAERLRELEQAEELVDIGSGDRRRRLHTDRLMSLRRSVMKTVREELERHQPRRTLPRTTIMAACRDIARTALIDAVLDRLEAEGELVRVGDNLGPADAQVKLSRKKRAAQQTMLEEITAAGLTPPTQKELAAATSQDLDQVNVLLNLCVEDGLLVLVGDGLFFSPEALEQGRQVCRDLLAEQGEATMSQLREAWGISRKFSVPLCEHFDKQGVTIRRQDVRVAGPSIDSPLV